MNYIVFDLEWNQPEKKDITEETGLNFEILEIGAVKLNEEKRIISKYQALIHPQVYQMINWRIRKMLDLKPGELEHGKPFPEACEKFLTWCGEDAVFCTWGSQDLSELQRNMSYYHMTPLSDKPLRYLNVQKLYGVLIGEENKGMSLEAAVEKEHVTKDVPFHRAYSDAYYTSKILRLIPKEIEEAYFSYDLYHLPGIEDKDVRMTDNGKVSYVTHRYEKWDELLADKSHVRLECSLCNKQINTPVVPLYYNGKAFFSAGICPEHGPMAMRLRIRHHELGGYYGERSLYPLTEETLEKMRENEKKYNEKDKSHQKTLPTAKTPTSDP